SSPLQFASVRAAVRTNRQLDGVPHKPLQQAVEAAMPSELCEDQTHDRLCLLVGIHHEVASNGPHTTSRRVDEYFTTLGLVPHALLQAALENVQFRFAHGPFQTQQ